MGPSPQARLHLVPPLWLSLLNRLETVRAIGPRTREASVLGGSLGFLGLVASSPVKGSERAEQASSPSPGDLESTQRKQPLCGDLASFVSPPLASHPASGKFKWVFTRGLWGNQGELWPQVPVMSEEGQSPLPPPGRGTPKIQTQGRAHTGMHTCTGAQACACKRT